MFIKRVYSVYILIWKKKSAQVSLEATAGKSENRGEDKRGSGPTGFIAGRMFASALTLYITPLFLESGAGCRRNRDNWSAESDKRKAKSEQVSGYAVSSRCGCFFFGIYCLYIVWDCFSRVYLMCFFFMRVLLYDLHGCNDRAYTDVWKLIMKCAL